MVEIALCLAIIAFALVAIIGVLPFAMNVQKENRQETIINQDSKVFMSAICNGERGLDDLTNYVLAITNYQTVCTMGGGRPGQVTPLGYTLYAGFANGHDIIGLLSTPKYVTITPGPRGSFYSNYVFAIVRSMSGPASEKYPQNNSLVQDLGLTYRMVPEVVPSSFSGGNWTNSTDLHEVRLAFRWPYFANNGALGPGRQVFRSTAGGRLSTNEAPFYFIQPRTY